MKPRRVRGAVRYATLALVVAGLAVGAGSASASKSDVVTIAPDAPLLEAAKIMFERKIGCLVVLDAGKIAGILTEGDFVKLVAQGI